jgi:hypothetical protein
MNFEDAFDEGDRVNAERKQREKDESDRLRQACLKFAEHVKDAIISALRTIDATLFAGATGEITPARARPMFRVSVPCERGRLKLAVFTTVICAPTPSCAQIRISAQRSDRPPETMQVVAFSPAALRGTPENAIHAALDHIDEPERESPPPVPNTAFFIDVRVMRAALEHLKTKIA